MSFELKVQSDGATHFVLEHRLITPADEMIYLGAGWHMHILALRAALAGAPPADRAALYLQLEPLYAERTRTQA